jgi:hypothetical protein
MSEVPHTPIALPSPNQPPTPPGGGPPPKTLTRWDSFIGDIASGVKLVDAMNARFVTRADIETMCRLDDGGVQRQRWHDARLSGRKREWSLFDFEDIFDRIAAGAKVDDAIMEVKGCGPGNFYALVNADPDLRAQYRTAKESYSLIVGETLMGIAADNSNDTIDNGIKGEIPNMAAVTRSKLQVDTGFRYIASYNTKLFGEKKDNVNVQVNMNLGERLEAARTREKLRDTRVTPKQMEQAVDAVFSEKPESPPTEWVDEPEEPKPIDTVWREEQ